MNHALACLCNVSIKPGALNRQVADIYLAQALKPEAARPEEPAAKLTKEQLADKAGVYHNPDGDLVRRITLKGGSLRLLQSAADKGIELKPLSASRFRPVSQPMEIRFEPAADAGMRCTSVPDGGGRPVVIERREEFKPTPEQLTEYVGQYQSARSSRSIAWLSGRAG